jgi:hypothetical protein
VIGALIAGIGWGIYQNRQEAAERAERARIRAAQPPAPSIREQAVDLIGDGVSKGLSDTVKKLDPRN